jgi:Phage integrase family
LGDESWALRELKRQSASPFVFASERGGPFTPSGFAKLLARAGDEAKIGFKVHPHMLRYACGYALANKGIDTALAMTGHPRRFPPPWTVEETQPCFIVRDHSGQALAFVYFEEEPGRRAAASLLTRDEARRIAAGIARLPELLRAEPKPDANALIHRR